ncbi:MAG: poly-gamma-glutamate hydrolase family protein [Ilumatobacteraceae bacterium]
MSDTPFRDLLASPGVREVCRLEGRLGFMAYHGGSLEHVTDVIADAAAAASGASYYGVLQPEDLLWHIPSHRVSPAESPTLAGFLEHVHAVITVHGYGRHGMWTTLLLGGQNRRTGRSCGRLPAPGAARLHDRDGHGGHPHRAARPACGEPGEPSPPPRRADRVAARVRGTSPIWKDWAGPGLVPHTQALIDALAAAALAWPA